jgi:hypothetical protein
VSTAKVKTVVCETKNGAKYFLLGGLSGSGLNPSLNTVGA